MRASILRWCKADKYRRREAFYDQLRNITERHRDCPLLYVPPEILLSIADHLPEEAKAALALTCKILWWKWRRLLSDHETRARLPVLLERDISGVFFCYQCEKLERIRPGLWPGSERLLLGIWSKAQGGAHVKPYGFWRRVPPEARPPWMIRLEDGPLNFYHAHLAMNGHRYGERHGLPLDALCLHRRRPFSASVVRTKRVVADTFWTPRIIDGELFLCHTIRISEPDNKVLASSYATQFVNSFSGSLSACYDLQGSAPEQWRDGPYRFQRASGSCGRCLKAGEYVQRVEEGARGWDIVLKTYYQLGRCEHPQDWKWACHISSCTSRPDRNRRVGHGPDGNVMEKWKNATGRGRGNVLLEEPFPIGRDVVRDIAAAFP